MDPYSSTYEDRLFKLDPLPFKHDKKNLGIDIKKLDTEPTMPEIMAFNKSLRQREPSKELAHSHFRIKDVTALDRLNN